MVYLSCIFIKCNHYVYFTTENEESSLKYEENNEQFRSEPVEKELKNEIVEGRNAVIEALRAGRAIDKIYLAKGETDNNRGYGCKDWCVG